MYLLKFLPNETHEEEKRSVSRFNFDITMIHPFTVIYEMGHNLHHYLQRLRYRSHHYQLTYYKKGKHETELYEPDITFEPEPVNIAHVPFNFRIYVENEMFQFRIRGEMWRFLPHYSRYLPGSDHRYGHMFQRRNEARRVGICSELIVIGAP